MSDPLNYAIGVFLLKRKFLTAINTKQLHGLTKGRSIDVPQPEVQNQPLTCSKMTPKSFEFCPELVG